MENLRRDDGSQTAELRAEVERLRGELERRERELAELEAERARLTLVLETLEVGFAELDPELRYLSFNRRAEQLAGQGRADLLGASMLELFPDLEGGPFHKALVEAVEEARKGRFEQYLPSWGRWFEGRVTPVPGGVLLVGTDITDRKKGEKALREATKELQRAKEAAEEANRAKDRFLATLSHELRTPLTPVLAVASALQRDDRTAGIRPQLEMIRRNVELEARLIDDLLDLTRIARGRLEVQPRAIDARQVLEQTLETCCPGETACGRIRVVQELDAEDHRVWADPSRFTQILWNLLNNAVKFTPSGGTVTLRTRLEEDGSWLAIEIADTGIGIDPGRLGQVFEAFEQGGGATSRRYGGLGLGLAISHAIVELHGGTLRAASEGPGRGSTFTVRLPVGPARAEPSPPACAEGRAEPAGRRGLEVLLVEDHPDTAQAMAELLELLGHRVTVARSVAEGRAAAEDRPDGFDLLLSDLGLPDGSGHDLMRELASRYGLRGIALSGYGMEEDLERSREAGFERHLTKPIDLEALKSALRQVAPRGEEGGP